MAYFQYYNNERPHSGRYCYCKTPVQTFDESLPLVNEKLVQPFQSRPIVERFLLRFFAIVLNAVIGIPPQSQRFRIQPRYL